MRIEWSYVRRKRLRFPKSHASCDALPAGLVSVPTLCTRAPPETPQNFAHVRRLHGLTL